MLLKTLAGFYILFTLTFCANAADPNAKELIEMYEKPLSVLNKSAYEIESKMEIEGVQNLKGPKTIMRKSIFYRDGDRWATIAEDQYVFEDSAKSVETLHYNRIVDKRSITWSSDGNEPVRAVIVDSDLKTGKAKAGNRPNQQAQAGRQDCRPGEASNKRFGTNRGGKKGHPE